jgi:DNA-binding protein Fis
MGRAKGNQTQAAELLGVNRNTLRAKLAKYELI